jgi:hypothetical protein
MAEPTEEHLQTIIRHAIRLYELCQPLRGMIPDSHVIQALLKDCGLDVDLERIKINRQIVLEPRGPEDTESYAED